MDITALIKVIILGVVEGVTEFLPISSTGHLIVATRILQYPPEVIRDTFEIFIQFGAVIAVVVFYARELLQMAQKLPSDRNTQRFWLNLFVAFLPAAVIGFLFSDQIKAALFNPVVVAISLIVGGIIFLLIERGERTPDAHNFDQLTIRHALTIGIAQVFALIPGVSRSGASIIGGMLSGLDRQVATKFSFYLAIPTLGIATLYDMFKSLRSGVVTGADLPIFGVGALVSFIVALIAIAWLLRFVANNSFRAFGIYRIVAGIIILALVIFFNLSVT
ncbi:MAG: undecaprenyl-diphosphate phosphatase [Anaerolineae bacterium]